MSESKTEVSEILSRPTAPALDEILGKEFKVLDKGFVRVVDYMGNDGSVVQAARTSYGKGTKTVSEDEGLIRYLLRHSHTTPVEMCVLKLHVRVPMDCWRQWIRHRMSSTNEYSTRYSEAIDDKQETPPDLWRLQSAVNKQGSSGCITEWPTNYLKSDAAQAHDSPGEYLSEMEKSFHDKAAYLYADRLDLGIAKEQARKDLPLSTYTTAYWKCDLHNLLHFLSLRMDSHAQLEIRSYANVIGDIVAKWVPLTWAAWNDYNFRRSALLLSARDKAIINAIINHQNAAPENVNNESRSKIFDIATEYGWIERREDGTLKDNRERKECEAKLTSLGLRAPWLFMVSR